MASGATFIQIMSICKPATNLKKKKKKDIKLHLSLFCFFAALKLTGFMKWTLLSVCSVKHPFLFARLLSLSL